MTSKHLTYEATELVPPGQTLLDWLDRVDMTQADFARRTSLTPKHINQVVKGGVGISADVALAFERVTAIPARYWSQLDANFQSAKHREEEAAELQEHLGLVDLFPVRELVRRGVIEKVEPKVGRLRELLKFFAVADADALEEVWLKPTLYRLSPSFDANQAALATWLRLAELEASEIETNKFDPARCRAALDEMRALSALPGIEWLEPLRRLAASVGIAVVILKELPGCRVNGATRWLSPDKAMIVLSLRHRRNDIFWFTFFHELCHLLRHSKKTTFVDTKDSGISAELEAEADAFASKTLIPPAAAPRLIDLTTTTQLHDFAKEIGVAPGIVVGRMQHEGYIPHSQWASLIQRYRFTDD
jgi:HTH-type transcriptional regulator / antitoxin HigA